MTMRPFNLSERNFKRFEQHISSAMRSNGDYTITTGDLNPTTFCARLRDAMRSYDLDHWDSTLDYDQFKLWRTSIFVHIKDNKVIISRVQKDLETVGEGVEVRGAVETSTKPTKYERVENPTQEELKAYAVLLHGSRITPILIIGVSEEEVRAACHGYDTEFLEEGNGFVML